jgi:hypothetical protein
LYILMFKFFDSRRDERRFCTEGSKHYQKSVSS